MGISSMQGLFCLGRLDDLWALAKDLWQMLESACKVVSDKCVVVANVSSKSESVAFHTVNGTQTTQATA